MGVRLSFLFSFFSSHLKVCAQPNPAVWISARCKLRGLDLVAGVLHRQSGNLGQTSQQQSSPQLPKAVNSPKKTSCL